MAYTNSSLVDYTNISPNKTSPRNHAIDTITIHCYVGQASVESMGSWFSKRTTKASCNYGIGADGRIALIVEEKDRSWCSSSSSNDHRAITIECACEKTAPYEVNDKVMKSLIELIADICKRNDIKELKWKGDKSLIGQVDKQNMTVHRWFKAKDCPGEYLYNKHSYIAEEVNKKLCVYAEVYRVRKTWADVASQLGAFSSLDNAKNACKEGYSVFNNAGEVVYTKPVPAPVETPAPAAKPATPAKLVPTLKVTANVKGVQTWLNKYYNAGLAVDGSYGKKTKKALIKAWQTEVGGLEIDGSFGSKSKKAASSHNIRKGSKGILVTIWQAALVCNGYNPKGIDGKFGLGCYTATLAFQKAKGLTRDGVVGANTWYKIFN